MVSWLRGPLRDVFADVVLAPDSPIDGFVNRAAVEALWRDHLRGAGPHGSVLWALLVLARWSQRYRRAPSYQAVG